MQGRFVCRLHLLLLACLWLIACQPTPSPTPEIENASNIVTRIADPPTTVELSQSVGQEIAPIPTPARPCAATAPGSSVVVTIGAILPLSSPGALLAGFAMQTALNIAVSDINERGGIHDTPVRLVTYDSAGVAERAAQFAERLILLDCAVGIVGLYHNAEAMAVTDVAHRYGIPVIVAEAGGDDITARGYPEVFRLAPTYSMIAQAPTAWLREVGDYNGDGTLALTIIADNVTSSSALVDRMVATLMEAEIETELLRVDLPSSDFSSAIARLVAQERLPDAIMITIKGKPALRLQTQLLNAGIGPSRATLLVQAHAGLDSREFWAEVPDGIGTVVMRRGGWANTITEQGQDFVIKYDQYLGRWPEPYAFAAFDAILLLTNALHVAESWHGGHLITALEQTDMPLTTSNVAFAHTSLVRHDTALPAYQWHQWLDSQILFLQYTEQEQPASAMTVIWPPHYRDPNQQSRFITIEQ